MSVRTEEIVTQDKPDGPEPVEEVARLGGYARDYLARVRAGQLADELENLLGLGDAERGSRLVEDDDLRLPEHLSLIHI